MKAAHVGHKDGCLIFYKVTRYQNIQFTCFMAKRDFLNLLTPNVNYSGRTARLTSKVAFYIFIQQI